MNGSHYPMVVIPLCTKTFVQHMRGDEWLKHKLLECSLRNPDTYTAVGYDHFPCAPRMLGITLEEPLDKVS